MKIKTVIFDMDGVIFDTENLCMRCWHQAAEEENMPDIEPFFYKCIGVNSEKTKAQFAEQYGERYSYDSFMKKANDAFFSYIEENGMPVKPGVVQLLDYLRDNGYKIGLASSTKEANVKSQLSSRNLLTYFQAVVCGDMVENSKPEPDIFLKACEEIGTAPKEAYAVEDSFHGIQAAYSAGMKAIMVPDILMPDDDIKRKAFRICSDLREVQKFLEKENSDEK